MRARLTRAGPWITPVLLVVEVVLVLSGILSLTDAVIVIVVVELALAIAALSRAAVALRSYRQASGAGVDGWGAAEDGLAEMVPRPAARMLLIEVRIWASLVRWPASRRRRGEPSSHPYGRAVRPLLMTVLALVVVEGLVVEGVLVAVLGHRSVWVWVALGLHLYGLVWLAGFLGSLAVEPHRITATTLRLGDSVFGSVSVPLADISGATAHRRSNLGRSGFRVEDGVGLLAYGDATVRIDLVENAAVEVGRRTRHDVRTLDVTADEPRRFLGAVRDSAPRLDTAPG